MTRTAVLLAALCAFHSLEAAAAVPSSGPKPKSAAPAKPKAKSPAKGPTATPSKPSAKTPAADSVKPLSAKRDTVAIKPMAPRVDSAAKPVNAPLRDLNQKALKVPEKLLFDIVWGGWSFSWVNAGQATLELLPGDNPEHWQIRSLAWCNRFFRTFYPVHDTVTSLIDARGIYPLRFEKKLHEKNYNADISATYDQAAHTLKTLDTTLSIEPFTHDVLSAFYYIRTLPLKVGDSFELAAVSGKKKYGLKVICHDREDVEVPAGRFHTLVVEPVLKDDGLFKAKGKLTIWVTDDAAHTPVKMESKIPVGSIKAELVSLP